MNRINWGSLQKDGVTHYWAYAYDVAKSKNNRKASILKPIEGVVRCSTFIPLGNSGKLCESKSRSIYNLNFVLTEKEAKENYNNLVKERENKLLEIIDKLKKDYV